MAALAGPGKENIGRSTHSAPLYETDSTAMEPKSQDTGAADGRLLTMVGCMLVPAIWMAGSTWLFNFNAAQLGFMAATASLVAVISIARLNSMVGYRWFDIAFLAVPGWNMIYLAKVLWRGVSLADPYWIETNAPNEMYRIATFGELTRAGAPREVASVLSFALFPFDDDVEPGRDFQAKMGELVIETAEKVRAAEIEQLDEVAMSSLDRYIDLAKSCDEEYYEQRYIFTKQEFVRSVSGELPDQGWQEITDSSEKAVSTDATSNSAD